MTDLGLYAFSYFSQNRLLPPKAFSYVHKAVARSLLIEPLVGGSVFQTTQMGDIRANLYVVEAAFVYRSRYQRAATVPPHPKTFVRSADMACKPSYKSRVGIAAHEANASNAFAMLAYKHVERRRREGLAHVSPKILAVASRATARAVGYVYGQGHFVGYFLKDNTRVHVLKHCWK